MCPGASGPALKVGDICHGAPAAVAGTGGMFILGPGRWRTWRRALPWLSLCEAQGRSSRGRLLGAARNGCLWLTRLLGERTGMGSSKRVTGVRCKASVGFLSRSVLGKAVSGPGSPWGRNMAHGPTPPGEGVDLWAVTAQSVRMQLGEAASSRLGRCPQGSQIPGVGGLPWTGGQELSRGG